MKVDGVYDKIYLTTQGRAVNMKRRNIGLVFLLILTLLLGGCQLPFGGNETPIILDDIPAYSGAAYISVNEGKPFFTEDEITDKSFESYSELDSLGRCNVAFACIGKDLMPPEDEEREGLGSVTPSGWEYNGKSNNNKYDTSLVENGFIYNRCHLIGFQLAGEQDNEKNLITGTRYLNIEGMLTFENMVAECVKKYDMHIMYRVTPIYSGNNLVADGVLMEGMSVEDNGEKLLFCVYAYNVQPGIYINYKNGTNCLAEDAPDIDETEGDGTNDSGESVEGGAEGEESGTDGSVESGGDTAEGDGSGDSSETVTGKYILNTSTKKFHKEDCRYATSMKEENREEYEGDKQSLIDDGYTACGTCKP